MQVQHGKVVWLPTIDADHHVKFFQDAPEGIKVVEGGKPGAAVREIIKLCADNDLIWGPCPPFGSLLFSPTYSASAPVPVEVS
jgi:hypothetical protein